MSLRVASAELVTLTSTIRNILPEYLKKFPYKMSFSQQILQEDYPLRLDYTQIILLELSNDSGNLEKSFSFDECIIYSSGVVKTHNERLWDLESPRGVKEAAVP